MQCGMSAKQELVINCYSSYKKPFPHQLLISLAHGVIETHTQKKQGCHGYMRNHKAQSPLY